MPAGQLTYSLVTPLRNELTNLKRLARCLSAQTVLPMAWVLVDNGSTDGTLAEIDRLRAEHTWIETIRVPGTERAIPGAPIVRAFHKGLEELDRRSTRTDVVVKLDADVSFDDRHFEALLAAFAQDPKLGIAGGVCLEREENDGEWRTTHVTGDHVRGAVRAYRREVLEAVLPLPEHVGWDGVDELKAAVLGWRTAIVASISFKHHRKVGARDGASHRRFIAQGSGAYFMGYRFGYLTLRALHHARRHPAALAMVWGYLAAAARRGPRFADPDVRRYLRQQQSFSQLARRRREALGRSS
jgi:biofilm PGA synthesis N-glycosyltransferase PgaC